MKPMVNNPAWVQAIQDVMDLIEAGAYPADQINADPGTTAFQQFLAGTGSMLMWWGDVGSICTHVGYVSCGRCRRVSGSTRHRIGVCTTHNAGEWEETRNEAPEHGLYRLGHVCHGHGSRATRRRKRRPGPPRRIWAARIFRFGRRPIRPASSLTATAHFNFDEWEEAGYDRAFVEDYLGSNRDSYNHPNGAIEPRIPGIFQYYSVAEDELAKGYAGQYGSAQETADAIAAAWEKITDQIGRESQIKLYKASLGL